MLHTLRSRFTRRSPRLVRQKSPLAKTLAGEFLEDRRVLVAGTFNNGVFDFCVSVRFDATDEQIEKIKTAFQNGSQILSDATDGQHRFGTITIVNDSGASQTAEYWVNSGGGRAYATYGQYGVRGEHVNLYFDDNFQAVSGADGDAYTIAHEHAHHAYGLGDEYSGPAGAAENAPTPDTATLNYSLMDNYFTRGGRAGGGATYTLNEFSVASNHDPDGDTWQTSINGESDWETIAKSKFPATAPAGLPTDAPPAAHAWSILRTATADWRRCSCSTAREAWPRRVAWNSPKPGRECLPVSSKRETNWGSLRLPRRHRSIFRSRWWMPEPAPPPTP